MINFLFYPCSNEAIYVHLKAMEQQIKGYCEECHSRSKLLSQYILLEPKISNDQGTGSVAVTNQDCQAQS